MTDLVNFDRIRGFLRTIYWRRKFLAHRDGQRRALNPHADGRLFRSPKADTDILGIPAIVLQPTPASPPMDEDEFPFSHDLRDLTPSPSPPGSPTSSADQRPVTHQDSRTSPSLSVSGHVWPRQHSRAGSLLSSEDAHRRSPSLADSDDQIAVLEQMDHSIWGGKSAMRRHPALANPVRYDARSRRSREERRRSGRRERR